MISAQRGHLLWRARPLVMGVVGEGIFRARPPNEYGGAAAYFGLARPLVSDERGRRIRARPPLGDSLCPFPGIVRQFPAMGAGSYPAYVARENDLCEESEKYQGGRTNYTLFSH